MSVAGNDCPENLSQIESKRGRDEWIWGLGGDFGATWIVIDAIES